MVKKIPSLRERERERRRNGSGFCNPTMSTHVKFTPPPADHKKSGLYRRSVDHLQKIKLTKTVSRNRSSVTIAQPVHAPAAFPSAEIKQPPNQTQDVKMKTEHKTSIVAAVEHSIDEGKSTSKKVTTAIGKGKQKKKKIVARSRAKRKAKEKVVLECMVDPPEEVAAAPPVPLFTAVAPTGLTIGGVEMGQSFPSSQSSTGSMEEEALAQRASGRVAALPIVAPSTHKACAWEPIYHRSHGASQRLPLVDRNPSQRSDGTERKGRCACGTMVNQKKKKQHCTCSWLGGEHCKWCSKSVSTWRKHQRTRMALLAATTA
jgi:hypothetical protein